MKFSNEQPRSKREDNSSSKPSISLQSLENTLIIVVPVFNEAENIVRFCAEIVSSLSSISKTWSLLFVNDGSSDNTLYILREVASKDNRIHYISLARNFGHQAALRAGLQIANSECVVTMDGDLQHPPEIIKMLLSEWQNGADIVNTKRVDDNNVGCFKKLTSMFYYKLFSWMAGIPIESGAADFRLIDRKALRALNSLPEQDLFLRGIVPWIGFNQAIVSYKPNERFAGKSRYTLKKMFTLAADGIFAFSTIPLRVASVLGLLVSIAAFFYALYAIFIFVVTKSAVSGWTSLLISVLLLGGVQLLSIGLLGEYVARTLRETKRRPAFIISESSFALELNNQ